MGIEIPKIQLRYEHLSVEGDVYIGKRAIPTLINVAMNVIEVFFYNDFFLEVKLVSGVEFCEKQRDILLGYFVVIFTKRTKNLTNFVV